MRAPHLVSLQRPRPSRWRFLPLTASTQGSLGHRDDGDSTLSIFSPSRGAKCRRERVPRRRTTNLLFRLACSSCWTTAGQAGREQHQQSVAELFIPAGRAKQGRLHVMALPRRSSCIKGHPVSGQSFLSPNLTSRLRGVYLSRFVVSLHVVHRRPRDAERSPGDDRKVKIAPVLS